MEHTILKKKLSTFKTAKGRLTRVSDEVLVDVIRAWETWPGKATDMAKELGLTMRQLMVLVEKAKKRLREGGISAEEFREIKVEGGFLSGSMLGPIELGWDQGRVIRFSQVDMRSSYDSLFFRVKTELRKDPFSGHLFLFVNSRRTTCKCFYYDGTGLVIISKRLERGVFSKINPFYRREIILTQAEFREEIY